jgi:hypothetical protein
LRMETPGQAGLRLILQRCVEEAVPVAELMQLRLVIVTDMPFDVADGQRGRYYGGSEEAFVTKVEAIKRSFGEAGYRHPVTGDGVLPRMLFWDVVSQNG